MTGPANAGAGDACTAVTGACDAYACVGDAGSADAGTIDAVVVTTMAIVVTYTRAMNSGGANLRQFNLNI